MQLLFDCSVLLVTTILSPISCLANTNDIGIGHEREYPPNRGESQIHEYEIHRKAKKSSKSDMNYYENYFGSSDETKSPKTSAKGGRGSSYSGKISKKKSKQSKKFTDVELARIYFSYKLGIELYKESYPFYMKWEEDDESRRAIRRHIEEEAPPTKSPSSSPSASPSQSPSSTPSQSPSASPSQIPSEVPSASPTISSAPTPPTSSQYTIYDWKENPIGTSYITCSYKLKNRAMCFYTDSWWNDDGSSDDLYYSISYNWDEQEDEEKEGEEDDIEGVVLGGTGVFYGSGGTVYISKSKKWILYNLLEPYNSDILGIFAEEYWYGFGDGDYDVKKSIFLSSVE